MIITAQQFLDSGMRVSSDVSETEISTAINSVEHFYLKPHLTEQYYGQIVSQPTVEPYKTLIKGGVVDSIHYAGLELAMCHLVYAFLLSDNMRITRYSTMEKNSEFSKNSNREDILEQARVHWNIGMSFVAEVQEYFGLDATHNNQNNLFETILV